MLRSKSFWIAMVILVPFIVVWIMYGLAWAVGMLGAIAVLSLFAFGSRRRRRYHDYYDEDYDEDDEEIIILERRRPRSSSSSERMRELYIPKVDKDFYVPSGLRNVHRDPGRRLRKLQQDDLKRRRLL